MPKAPRRLRTSKVRFRAGDRTDGVSVFDWHL